MAVPLPYDPNSRHKPTRAEEKHIEALYNRGSQGAIRALKLLGWRSPTEVPLRTKVWTIAAGSTGVYEAEWNGTYWLTYDGDVWVSATPPLLWKEQP